MSSVTWPVADERQAKLRVVKLLVGQFVAEATKIADNQLARRLREAVKLRDVEPAMVRIAVGIHGNPFGVFQPLGFRLLLQPLPAQMALEIRFRTAGISDAFAHNLHVIRPCQENLL